MANTYVAIAKTVLTGTQATITFSSIPSTYTDLVLLTSCRTDYAGTWIGMTISFNGSPTQSNTYLYGDGSSTVGSTRPSTTYIAMADGDTATSNTFSNLEWYIPNYATTSSINMAISAVTETNSAAAGSVRTVAQAKLIQKTSAINEITITPQSGLGLNFTSGSRFDLYGIKNS